MAFNQPGITILKLLFRSFSFKIYFFMSQADSTIGEFSVKI
jgi:hypothetical protein